ncbi:cbb3-type cytochrome c oxidase subunit 3 [Enterovibrio makurazakiensis]|uniref:Cbb3-type cytochrome c oxidase subunit 3 n=1 Tax=Enterovibrio gelatinilyticus TaxID=2899819 RepID=A0ABT5QUC6_9GAMM|nr:cbb3-type cytochrome c oxidase subunit 3 [Enterovibrio sp. ZSDZ42]MDD1791603.1 cbb3-type cytochrome c oxidase subunit 3 [Enterovibrio sp. ZSDZ42]
MEIVSFHSIWTLVIFVSFIGIVLWAYSSRRKTEFEDAANLVFADEEKGAKKTGEDNK